MSELRKKFRFEFRKRCEKPFLSIITRTLTKKRPIAQRHHAESIELQDDKSFEEIFIYDDHGLGMLAANFSLAYVKDQVSGEMVFFLDDDDYLKRRDFISSLRKIWSKEKPDIIFFKAIIHLDRVPGNIYPTEKVWKKQPLPAQIGGSCFVVSKRWYQKYIYHFGHSRMGDFHFISSIMREKNLKIIWCDKVFVETSYKGKGRAEVSIKTVHI